MGERRSGLGGALWALGLLVLIVLTGLFSTWVTIQIARLMGWVQ